MLPGGKPRGVGVRQNDPGGNQQVGPFDREEDESGMSTVCLDGHELSTTDWWWTTNINSSAQSAKHGQLMNTFTAAFS